MGTDRAQHSVRDCAAPIADAPIYLIVRRLKAIRTPRGVCKLSKVLQTVRPRDVLFNNISQSKPSNLSPPTVADAMVCLFRCSVLHGSKVLSGKEPYSLKLDI